MTTPTEPQFASEKFAERFKAAKPEAEKAKDKTIRGLTKKQSEFFAAVRNRGMLNAMLDGPATQYETAHPGMKCRWEYWPPNGDNTRVVAREAQGFRLVDAADMGAKEPSAQKAGVVRRGDVVLMTGPEALVALIAQEDAEAAQEDWKLPETTYREHIADLKVQLKDGSIIPTPAEGKIRRTEEIVGGVVESQHELAD